jgi:hypothetical protein
MSRVGGERKYCEKEPYREEEEEEERYRAALSRSICKKGIT